MKIEILEKAVNQAKEEFITQVNGLNFLKTQMIESPGTFSDSTLERMIRGVVETYENYINSKIKFTEEYFKDK